MIVPGCDCVVCDLSRELEGFHRRHLDAIDAYVDSALLRPIEARRPGFRECVGCGSVWDDREPGPVAEHHYPKCPIGFDR